MKYIMYTCKHGLAKPKRCDWSDVPWNVLAKGQDTALNPSHTLSSQICVGFLGESNEYRAITASIYVNTRYYWLFCFKRTLQLFLQIKGSGIQLTLHCHLDSILFHTNIQLDCLEKKLVAGCAKLGHQITSSWT